MIQTKEQSQYLETFCEIELIQEASNLKKLVSKTADTARA